MNLSGVKPVIDLNVVMPPLVQLWRAAIVQVLFVNPLRINLVFSGEWPGRS